MALTHEEKRNHQCRKEVSWWECDARGIPLCRVCDICKEAKLSIYRRDVLDDSNYIAEEEIEPDTWERAPRGWDMV